VNGKYIKSSIADASATAFAADGGLGIANPWSDKWRHAIVIQNVGSSIDYDKVSNALPTVVKFGNAWQARRNLILALDLMIPKSASAALAFGGELALPVNDQFNMFLRAGYGTEHRDLGNLSGLGLGGGISFAALRLDYAWVPEDDLGSSHVITLAYRFSSKAGAPTPTESAATPPPVATALKVDVQPKNKVTSPTTRKTPARPVVKTSSPAHRSGTTSTHNKNKGAAR
jgi:hypothetical protein